MPLNVPFPGPALTFTVDADSDAVRVSGVLSALGYDVRRVVPASQWSEDVARLHAVQRLATIYSLTTREIAFAQGVLDDADYDGHKAIQGDPSMVKVVYRSTLMKCGCDSIYELRAKIEVLLDVRGSDVEAKAAQLDELCALLGCEASDRPVEKVRALLSELGAGVQVSA